MFSTHFGARCSYKVLSNPLLKSASYCRPLDRQLSRMIYLYCYNQRSKIFFVTEMLHNPLTRFFLSHVLISMDHYILALPETLENTTCELNVN